jgi:predicted dehydrogenase
MGTRLIPGLQFFSDTERMIQELNPDCVYVCTPPPTHVEVVRSILRAGTPKAIFVEKPLASRGAEARALAEEAQRRSILGVVGFQRRFNGVFCETRRLLQQREIGEVRLFRAIDLTAGPMGPATGWRGEPQAGGVTMEWGIHLLDLLLWMFGIPSAVRARRVRIFSDSVEDFASAWLSFPGGVSGTAEWGWNLRNYAPPELGLEIHGTEGVIGVNEDRLVVYPGRTDTSTAAVGRPPPRVIHASTLTPMPSFLLGQPENVWQEVRFHDALDGRDAPENGWVESVRLHELIDTIRDAPLE